MEYQAIPPQARPGAQPPMNATQRAARSRYLEDAVTTVAPHTLVVMLYDRLLKDCDGARVAISEKDFYTANHCLQHAQDILVELHSALDPKKWEHATQLGSIYLYLINELTEANLKKDAKRVAQCQSVITPLRDAWSEAAALVSAGNATFAPTPPAIPSIPAGSSGPSR